MQNSGIIQKAYDEIQEQLQREFNLKGFNDKDIMSLYIYFLKVECEKVKNNQRISPYAKHQTVTEIKDLLVSIENLTQSLSYNISKPIMKAVKTLSAMPKK